jgi:hypothetical protein
VTPVAAIRDATPETLTSSSAQGLWAPSFPSAELVSAAAALIPAVREAAGPATSLAEGPRWEFVIAPGALQVRTRDWAKRDRTEGRERARQGTEVDQMAGWLRESGRFPNNPAPSREITSWSRVSRCNMTRTFCQIDYTPMFEDPTRLPAMVTLTYPGDWLTVAPNGRAVKAHLKAFRKRYERAWGEPLRCLWKLEFQRRGAPHVHMLMVPPHGRSDAETGQHFREWLSITWAAVVDHPDPNQYRRHYMAGTGVDWAEGLKSTDPKRVAIYFTKHGAFRAKEYQHCVPEPWQEPGQGPGRFWGRWGLEIARVGVRVSPQDGVKVGRLLRRWAHAQGTTRQVTVARTKGGAATSAYPAVIGLAGARVLASRKVRYRTSRVRVNRLPDCRGWVSVNDGAVFASQISRWLECQ